MWFVINFSVLGRLFAHRKTFCQTYENEEKKQTESKTKMFDLKLGSNGNDFFHMVIKISNTQRPTQKTIETFTFVRNSVDMDKKPHMKIMKSKRTLLLGCPVFWQSLGCECLAPCKSCFSQDLRPTEKITKRRRKSGKESTKQEKRTRNMIMDHCDEKKWVFLPASAAWVENDGWLFEQNWATRVLTKHMFSNDRQTICVWLWSSKYEQKQAVKKKGTPINHIYDHFIPIPIMNLFSSIHFVAQRLQNKEKKKNVFCIRNGVRLHDPLQASPSTASVQMAVIILCFHF